MFTSKVKSMAVYGFRFMKAVCEATVEQMKENKTPLLIAGSIVVGLFIIAKVCNVGWLILVAKLMVLAIVLDIVIGVVKHINNKEEPNV